MALLPIGFLERGMGRKDNVHVAGVAEGEVTDRVIVQGRYKYCCGEAVREWTGTRCQGGYGVLGTALANY